MNQPVPLSVDPIGDFMLARGHTGPGAGGEDQTRLERFRREFPGLPLADLGGPELAEHLAALQASGVPPAELEVTRSICQEFLEFKNRHGGGFARGAPRPETRREMPYAVSRAGGATSAAAAKPYVPRRSSNNTVTVVLLVAAALGGGWYAWKHFQAGPARTTADHRGK